MVFYFVNLLNIYYAKIFFIKVILENCSNYLDSHILLIKKQLFSKL